MFNVRLNFIFAPIKMVLKLIFKVIYKILSLFHLQFFLFVVLVGAILFLTGVLNDSEIAKIITFIVVCISLVYALVMTIRSLLGLNRKGKKKYGKVEVLDTEYSKDAENELKQQENPNRENSVSEKMPTSAGEDSESSEGIEKYFTDEQPKLPKYFAVRGKPDYVMAEFDDRYELYLKSGNGLKRVRIDYKQ